MSAADPSPREPAAPPVPVAYRSRLLALLVLPSLVLATLGVAVGARVPGAIAKSPSPRQIPADPPVEIVGQLLPDVQLTVIDGSDAEALRAGEGEPWSRETLRGRPAVVFLWARWCRSCFEPMGAMQSLQQSHPDIPFYAVSIDRNPAVARAIVARMEDFRLPVVLDSRCLLMGQLHVQAMPSFYVLDSEGVIRHRFSGFHEERTLRQMEEVLDDIR